MPPSRPDPGLTRPDSHQRFGTGHPFPETGSKRELPVKDLLAKCCHGLHSAFMAVQITIRGVPEAVRDELAVRAAAQRKSMQEYLRSELERIASRPSLEAWLQQVRERKEAAGTRIRTSSILSVRDADRT
ncbi:MAG: hypothetical protein OXC01_06455 [Immundisolibacterales bacterium]|nr:hypothetical protein [Immundisolibacterales bacterium]